MILLAFSGCQTPTEQAGDGGLRPDASPPTPDAAGAGGAGGGGGGSAPDAADTDAGPPGDGAVPEPPPEAGPGRRLLRRLAHDEYALTVADLLGLQIDPEAAFGADPRVHGFANHADELRISALLVDQYRATAERLAQEVDLARIRPCGSESVACAQQFVRTFGARAFRRPITEVEAARYDALHALVAADEGFEAGLRAVVEALLQSPHFLHRTELGRREGDLFTLTPYELAAGLSYLLWRTQPDDTLWAKAADGTLLDPAVRAEEVARMLDDPRTSATVRAFVVSWLGLDQLAQVPRDPDVYPEATPALRALLAEETDALVTRLWASQGGLADLFLDSTPYPPLAAHYAGEPDGVRAGILTHGGVLTTWALPRSSSPIHRGLLVREHLLCQDLPPPPANLDTSPPEVDPTLSTRERYAQHADDPACAGCHQLIDPIGFVFEHFDGVGRYRAMDGMHPIDARGQVLGLANPAVDGVVELSRLLADSPQVSACYARQWLRYGYGGEEALAADAAVADLTSALQAADGALSAPLLGLLAHPHFTHRRGGPTEEDVPGAELTPSEPGEPPPEMPPTEPPPDEPGPVDGRLELREASRWQTGYCADGVVTNPGEADLTWVVEADIEGTINNLWNAMSDAQSGRVTFTGMPYNAVLGPGQSAHFGFCATLP